MKKVKKILALAAVVIIIGVYILTFISAIFVRPEAMQLFKVCIALTIFMPIVIWGYMIIYKLLNPKKDDEMELEQEDEPENKDY